MNRETVLKLLIAAYAVFAPVKHTLGVVLLFLGIDLVTGILAAIKQKQPITSGGLKKTIVKAFVYEGVVMMAFLFEQFLGGDTIPMVKIMAGYIGVTEFKSILENLKSITGMDIIKSFILKLGPPSE